MNFSQALFAAAAASGSVMFVNLLSKVLDPFVALVAATKPGSPTTAWSLGRAAKAAGLVSITVVLAAPFVGGRDALIGAVVGAPAGALGGAILGGVGVLLYVAIRRLPHGRSNGFLHSASMAARWPRGRPARAPSRGTWQSRPFGAHVRLALLHRVRSPLLPLRVAAGLLGIPAVLAVHSALLERGWDAAAAVMLPAHLVAALNLADADVSPVANLGGRSALSLHSPKGIRRLAISNGVAALVPILGPIVPALVALTIASGLYGPVTLVPAALVASVAALAYGSSRILDATEEIPAPLDTIADMVPMNGARALNLGFAELVLAGVVWFGSSVT